MNERHARALRDSVGALTLAESHARHCADHYVIPVSLVADIRLIINALKAIQKDTSSE